MNTLPFRLGKQAGAMRGSQVDRQLPLFFDLANKKCLVIGSGTLALEKARVLLNFGASVMLLSPVFSKELMAFQNLHKKCSVVDRGFNVQDLSEITLVVSATQDIESDRVISDASKDAGIPVNVVDNRNLSTFSFPAIVDRGSIQVGISSGGKSPGLVTKLKDELEVFLPHNLGLLANLISQIRPIVKEILPSVESRRKFWRGFLEKENSNLVMSQGADIEPKKVHSLVQRIISGKSIGRLVTIVGAGPGDPELLTVKALRKIQEADVLVYDRLVGIEILKRARKESKKIFVGKTKGSHSCGQNEINSILLEEAVPGRSVIRLKGGDPFIFGRGGEERAFLMSHGIEVEVIPGITAALGCGAASGIPMTMRDASQAVTFITGHGDGELELNWKALANFNQTLVVYMGVGAAENISQNLIDNGMSADVSAAVVANGTTPEQKLVIGKVGSLPLLISESDIAAPAIIIIGKVAEQSRLEIMHLAQQVVVPSTNILQNRDSSKKINTSEAIL
tara:strand:+ start:1872 stop:3398 length:1527 start_codon:yes stop_codon:yes gene_type:complete